MNGNWIKLNRRILDWGWYGDINTKVMFIHCLLKANWTAGEWHGVQYDPGEFITSLPSLCEETGLTNQQARTALKHLEATGELTVRTTDRATGKQLNRCRVIQVNKWSQYQGDNSQNDNQLTGNSTGKQQASNRQATGKQQQDKKEKKEKNVRNYISRARARARSFNNSEERDRDMSDLERKLLETN